MVYRGHVRNGKVELDGAADLTEWAAVGLNIVPPAAKAGDGERSPGESPGERPSIEDELDRIWDDVPESEWHKLPADLTAQLDHHIYGTPKRLRRR